MSRHLRQYKHAVKTHGVFHHQFIRAFAAGELSKAQVKLWLVQQCLISMALPQCFAAIFALVPTHLAPLAQKLAQVVGSEAWGEDRSVPSNGTRLCLLASLGFDLDLRLNPPKQEEIRTYTKDFIAQRLMACLPPHELCESVAAIALGNEILNMHLMVKYRQGILKMGDLKNCPLSYFDTHAMDEPKKFMLLDDLYWQVCPDGADEPREYRRLLQARENWFDGLWADIQKIRD